MSKIMDELLASTSTKAPKGGVVDQAFMLKLSKSVDDLDDDDYGKLSDAAQRWANAAATARTNKEDIVMFKDYKEPAAPAGDEEEEDEEVAKTAKKTVAKKAVAKKAAPAAAKKAAPAAKKAVKEAEEKPAKKAAPKAPKPAKEKSMRRFIKELVVDNPTMSVEDLTKKVEKAGYEAGASTITSIRSDTRDTLKVAKELGAVLKSLDL